MDRNERQYWVAFGRVPQIGRARISLLEGRFPSMEEAWQASPVALEAAGLKGKALSALLAARDGLSPDAELVKRARLGVPALSWHGEA